MTSFFDDLERQLLEAARERPQRLRRARLRRAAAGGAAMVALLAAGVGVAAGLEGRDGPDRAPAGVATTVETTTASREPLGQFTVAVLNGTTTPRAARNVAHLLGRRGAHVGVVRNALDQTVQRSRIYFRRGHQLDAASIASMLADHHIGLWQADDSSDILVLAGAEANVVVLVGDDLVFPQAASP